MYVRQWQKSTVDVLSIVMHSHQLEWLTAKLDLNKQHRFAPYKWLAHISCCLLWSITSDGSDKAVAPLQCSISCTSLSRRSDGISLSANLSLEIQASQLWHMLKEQQRCDYSMEEECQLLNDPHTYWWKRMRCQNKSGNRPEYIKWWECPLDWNQFCPFL